VGGPPPNLNALMQEYVTEIDRLRDENNQIRFAKDLRERDFENVMFENAQLQNKLENLENVFIGASHRKAGGQPMPNQEGMSQDYRMQNLVIENNDLKRRVFLLEQEKAQLQ
jgi:kinesin family member 12